MLCMIILFVNIIKWQILGEVLIPLIYKFTRKLINKYILIPHNLGDDSEPSRVSISNV